MCERIFFISRAKSKSKPLEPTRADYHAEFQLFLFAHMKPSRSDSQERRYSTTGATPHLVNDDLLNAITNWPCSGRHPSSSNHKQMKTIVQWNWMKDVGNKQQKTPPQNPKWYVWSRHGLILLTTMAPRLHFHSNSYQNQNEWWQFHIVPSGMRALFM